MAARCGLDGGGGGGTITIVSGLDVDVLGGNRVGGSMEEDGFVLQSSSASGSSSVDRRGSSGNGEGGGGGSGGLEATVLRSISQFEESVAIMHASPVSEGYKEQLATALAAIAERTQVGKRL